MRPVRIPPSIARIAAAGLALTAVLTRAEDLPGRDALLRWARDAEARTEASFRIAGSDLSSETAAATNAPAFLWSCGVQLSALTAAARLDPAARPRAERYAHALKAYWNEAGPVPGYGVLPGQRAPDRYYDDNAWLALALVELYDLTRSPDARADAERALRFTLSGEDGRLGGGLFWREKEKTTKNTCANAPAIVGALRLYRATQNKTYLETARRLHRWTREHLQAPDGLFWDSVALDGRIDRTLFAYNSALMIRANLAFYELSGDPASLAEAERIAARAADRWCAPDGAVAESGRFAHLLMGAFAELSSRSGDARWRDAVLRTARHLHARQTQPGGLFPDRWDDRPGGPPNRAELLDQASVVRLFWEAAAAAN